ncbi:hypothetical protein EYF80_032377 [Liparis tanakae]|uniref:Uncharacterized protein n=1 Tax=Liparis tanakae TaxID=230148 RepID=A0A4Z2GV34_9TELE|nr:hypothetical protein EYF80_032377 [Liparis tanakae]
MALMRGNHSKFFSWEERWERSSEKVSEGVDDNTKDEVKNDDDNDEEEQKVVNHSGRKQRLLDGQVTALSGREAALVRWAQADRQKKNGSPGPECLRKGLCPRQAGGQRVGWGDKRQRKKK